MYVKNINGIIPFTEKQIDITLGNNDLIITGKNGCGKTQLLDSIFSVLNNAARYKQSYLSHIISQGKQKETLEKNLLALKANFEEARVNSQEPISNLKNAIEIQSKQLISHPQQKEQCLRRISKYELQLKKYEKNNDPKSLEDKQTNLYEQFENQKVQSIKQLDQFRQLKQINTNKKLIKHVEICYDFDSINSESNLELILFFEANRVSSFQAVQNIGSLEQEKIQIKQQSTNGKNSNAGSLIEKFLANWEVKSALREKKKDYTVTKELIEWKKQFVKSLRVLLDDDSTDIEFNDDTLNYEIKQEGKERFSFRDLSSGYSAILKVFVELLMQTEVSDYTPSSISGYVIIDEIDVHLHASLQRKVLPFLSSLFPKVQFIVSTHSPFVLMSVDNAVIFDMEKNAQMQEDLSFYSYSAVLEGILGIKPTSLILEKTISNLSDVMNAQDVDQKKLEKLIDTIEPLSDKLNSREKSFYLQGVNILSDMDVD